ncbi:MAG: penicillin-binding protein 2 [Gammaproteobacteria bacterium]
MSKLPPLKDAEKERRLFQTRILIACAFMALLVAIILARLVYLQVLHHGHFTTLSQDNRLKVLPLAPPRGNIYSRDGTILAENRPSFSLGVVPENAEDLDAALAELSELLGLDEDAREHFTRQLRFARRFEDVTLKNDLSEEELAIFSVNQFRFPGFSVRSGTSRHYPEREATAHVLGYVGRISEADLENIDESNYSATTHIGKIGVERAREDLLHGQVGYQTVEINAQGRILRVVERTPPVPGADLYRTLDARLQQEAMLALEGRRGAVVAIEPASGGVLAFVSTPSFDPNAFVNGIGRKLYRAWSTSSDRPLFNRALQGQYPPGSTIKPLVALAGLETKLRDPEQTTWCPGWYSLPGKTHRYRDWLKRGHGHVDLKHSIAHSCDVYYYKLAQDLGIKPLHDALKRFGLGEITGIDIPGERAGLVPSPKWKKRARKQPWYPGETLIAGIGQGFMLTTPLQLAHATAVIAMRGEVAIPHFLDQIEASDGVMPLTSDLYRRPRVKLSDETHWDEIIEGMVEVVHGPTGTARRSGAGAPVRFAGKTGTAQVYGIAQDADPKKEDVADHLKDHALFVAFAPVENPQIALSVIVENGGGGSSTAAPIARRLLDVYFDAAPPGGAGSGPAAAAPQAVVGDDATGAVTDG